MYPVTYLLQHDVTLVESGQSEVTPQFEEFLEWGVAQKGQPAWGEEVQNIVGVIAGWRVQALRMSLVVLKGVGLGVHDWGGKLVLSKILHSAESGAGSQGWSRSVRLTNLCLAVKAAFNFIVPAPFNLIKDGLLQIYKLWVCEGDYM